MKKVRIVFFLLMVAGVAACGAFKETEVVLEDGTVVFMPGTKPEGVTSVVKATFSCKDKKVPVVSFFWNEAHVSSSSLPCGEDEEPIDVKVEIVKIR